VLYPPQHIRFYQQNYLFILVIKGVLPSIPTSKGNTESLSESDRQSSKLPESPKKVKRKTRLSKSQNDIEIMSRFLVNNNKF